MQVNLIQKTDNPAKVMYIACRNCYSALELADICKKEVTSDKMQELVLKVLDSGHKSIAEHVFFTFAIDGVSRACMSQLTRHRCASYSIKSLRYVEIKEDFQEVMSLIYQDNMEAEAKAMFDKYFVNPYPEHLQVYNSCQEYSLESLTSYLALIRDGSKPEDARSVLTQNFKTSIVMTCNLRELMLICNERLCVRAQTEIQEMVGNMAKEVLLNEEYRFLTKFLTAKCATCTEMDGCNG